MAYHQPPQQSYGNQPPPAYGNQPPQAYTSSPYGNQGASPLYGNQNNNNQSQQAPLYNTFNNNNYYNAPAVGTAPKPEILQQQRPSGPNLWYCQNNGNNNANANLYSLPIRRCNVNVETHVATAFCTLTAEFINTAPHQVTGLFVFPLLGTVTAAHVSFSGSNRLLETAVLPSSDINQLVEKHPHKSADQTIIPQMEPTDKYVADLFRLPISDINPNSVVTVTIEYMEPLDFVDYNYHLMIPLKCAPLAGTPQQVFSIKVLLNSITPQPQYKSGTHQLQVAQARDYQVELNAFNGRDDFHLQYYMPSEEILAALITEPGDMYSHDNRGSFALFVTPPTRPMPDFPRNFVFLVDRSGSMTGKPFDEACKALDASLQLLTPHDYFNVVAFDDQQVNFAPHLVPTTPQSIRDAGNWIRNNGPRGLTNIRTPLLWSLDLLKAASIRPDGSKCLSFSVLLTDGCVDQERELVNEVKNNIGDARILTFGIGPYCNWYFLKMLALMSRGFSANVMYEDKILPEMTHLMKMASHPILSDVTLKIPTDNCELYPYPIPDMFVGAPLTIAGKFNGQSPSSITLCGRTAQGQEYNKEIQASNSVNIRPSKVFLKQQIDGWTAQHWLNQDEKLKEQIVKTSVEQSFPSAHTTMVAYETTQEKKDEEEKEEAKNKKNKKKSSGPSAGTIAAAAVGGIFVVGAALYVFGDLGATISGASGLMVSAGGFLGDIGSAVGGLMCDCCGAICSNISCGICGDCGWLSNACNSVFGFCGDISGGVCGWLGNCLGGGLCKGCQSACEGGICDICGSICGFCGDGFGAIGDCCGSICGPCLDIGGSIVGSCGDICGSCGGILGSVCGVCGDVCGSCGDIVGGVGDVVSAVTDAVS